MNSALPDLSGKIESLFVDLLCRVDAASKASETSFFITGATARDFVLEHIYGEVAPRATADIDLAIAVRNWQQYNGLRARLIEDFDFAADRHEQQRLLYGNVAVDILPFGGVVDADYQFNWPPDHDVRMNVIGFEEAQRACIEVRLSPQTTVRVVTLPGLVLLKLFAWNDRRHRNNKDAIDLATILDFYNRRESDRAFADVELLESTNFDLELATAHILGRDVGALCEGTTLAALIGVLAAQCDGDRCRLAEDMALGRLDFSDELPRWEAAVRRLYLGVQEVAKRV